MGRDFVSDGSSARSRCSARRSAGAQPRERRLRRAGQARGCWRAHRSGAAWARRPLCARDAASSGPSVRRSSAGGQRSRRRRSNSPSLAQRSAAGAGWGAGRAALRWRGTLRPRAPQRARAAARAAPQPRQRCAALLAHSGRTDVGRGRVSVRMMGPTRSKSRHEDVTARCPGRCGACA